MTSNDKVNRVKMLLQNDPKATNDVVSGYLDMASNRITHTAYPFMGMDEVKPMPSKYDAIQCELAARMFSRRGGLGESKHDENGISRTWESAIDMDLLQQITPVAKVV